MWPGIVGCGRSAEAGGQQPQEALPPPLWTAPHSKVTIAGEKNLQLGISYSASIGTQTFGSQSPPFRPLFRCLLGIPGCVCVEHLVLDCLPLAAPIGLSRLLSLTLRGSEHVFEPLDESSYELSCLTTPGVGCPGDGLLPVALTRCSQMQPPSPCWVCRLYSGGGGGPKRYFFENWRLQLAVWVFYCLFWSIFRQAAPQVCKYVVND